MRHAGRYELHERIGEGGMGIVYAAFDPKLQRKLAVKFVIPWRDSARARGHLLREAQALAQIRHPNVVSVHDVGEANGQVFMVMDYVEGDTLVGWIESRTRTWREVVAMFVQAGRGLAAAHALGMVHRDFKPQNVLVDGQGLAHVVDFGLVSELEESSESSDSEAARTSRAEVFAAQARASEGGTLADESLTHSGAIVGTPAYMAPEQREGHGADQRSDQFSFCVALFEGVYGRRPPEQGAGEEGEGAEHGSLPPQMLRALQRGLSTDPAQRWPSMDSLLEVLERTLEPPPKQLSRPLMLGVGAALLVSMSVLLSFDRLRAWWSPVTLDVRVVDTTIVAPMALHEGPSGQRYAASVVANKGRIELDVELPVAGRYYLHGLVWEPTLGGARGDADSLFVYVDDGQEILWHIGCQNEVLPEHVLADNWSWQPVFSMPNADSDCKIDTQLAWELDAGSHHIVFRNREDAPAPELATRLAQVVITNQRDWQP